MYTPFGPSTPFASATRWPCANPWLKNRATNGWLAPDLDRVHDGLHVAAVVDGATAHRVRPLDVGHPRVRPLLATDRGMPSGAAVDGDFHAGHDAAARIDGGAAHDVDIAAREDRAG